MKSLDSRSFLEVNGLRAVSDSRRQLDMLARIKRYKLPGAEAGFNDAGYYSGILSKVQGWHSTAICKDHKIFILFDRY
jgi:hypothetical protein